MVSEKEWVGGGRCLLCEELIKAAILWYSPTNSFPIQQKKKGVELWTLFQIEIYFPLWIITTSSVWLLPSQVTPLCSHSLYCCYLGWALADRPRVDSRLFCFEAISCHRTVTVWNIKQHCNRSYTLLCWRQLFPQSGGRFYSNFWLKPEMLVKIISVL